MTAQVLGEAHEQDSSVCLTVARKMKKKEKQKKRKAYEPKLTPEGTFITFLRSDTRPVSCCHVWCDLCVLSSSLRNDGFLDIQTFRSKCG